MSKRGPGLHHIAIDVINLEDYILGLSGSGWLLHPKSLETKRKFKNAYLARPGVPALIEVQERDGLSSENRFIDRLEMPFNDEQMRLIHALGTEGLIQSNDQFFWLSCRGKRFLANDLWS